MDPNDKLSCPSAPHDLPGAKVFGVVLGDETAPQVAYLAKQTVLDPGLDLAGQGVDPGHAFRFTGACAQSGCGQWSQGGCRLGRDIAARMKPVVDAAPACTIRATCRWFAENGVSACLRCPQVTTRVMPADAQLYAVAKDVPARRSDAAPQQTPAMYGA